MAGAEKERPKLDINTKSLYSRAFTLESVRENTIRNHQFDARKQSKTWSVPPVFLGGVFSEITMCIAIFVYVMIGRNGYHLFQHRPYARAGPDSRKL